MLRDYEEIFIRGIKSKGGVHKMIQISGRILSKNYNLKLETFFFRSAHRMI